MSQRLSTRTERALNTWQVVAEHLLREPVRDAVREALADEGLQRQSSSVRGRAVDESSDGGFSFFSPKVLVPLIGLAAVLLYARRQNGSLLEEPMGDTGEPATATHRTTGTPQTVAEETGSEGAGEEGGSDVEGSDEEAAARS